MLDVMLSTTPVGTRQEMCRKSSGATLGSIPSFSGDILDHAVGCKGGDDTCDVPRIHAPHITRQHVVNLLTILKANCSSGHVLLPYGWHCLAASTRARCIPCSGSHTATAVDGGTGGGKGYDNTVSEMELCERHLGL